LVVLPGVAFTKDCRRLGHGKGFYDSFIAKHFTWCQQNNVKNPALIGIGLQEQLLEDVPSEEHDRRLDRVVIAGSVYPREP
jgi:5-formyltetrahydrofolate cyclo-ligase